MKPDHCMCIQYRSICSLRRAQGAGEPQTLALYVCTVRYCTSQAGIQTQFGHPVGSLFVAPSTT